MSDKDGGPAFGGSWDTVYFDTKGQIEPQRMERRAPGMSLRDYFAAQALSYFSPVGPVADADTIARAVATACYMVADAMLKERAK